MAHFSEESKIYELEDYDLETDDDIEGLLEETDEFSIYAFAKYEGDKDFVIDLRVLKVNPDQYLIFKINRVGVYQNEEDEYEDVKALPLAFIWEQVELGFLFTELSGATKVKVVTYVKPSAGIMFKLLAWLANTLSMRESRRYLKRWAAIVQKYA